jgi:predicted ATPase
MSAAGKKETTEKTSEDYLRDYLKAGKFAPFIKHIRFPYFKNLESETRVNFTYPITAFVGANGTNKSSILRALFGASDGHNIGDHWFSTVIDPIQEANGERNCYIYGYYNTDAGQDVEVLIQRTPYRKGKGNPDYWESSRPVQKHNMAPIPELPNGEKSAPGRSETRWNNIKKNVELMDFRSQLSAFDKFFYHNELRNTDDTPRNRKDFARRRAPLLSGAIQTKVKRYGWYGERVIGDNRDLNSEELNAVSQILGRTYASISLIAHRFYNCSGYTALMQSAYGMSYSEAFAGSGEFAAIMAVVRVTGAVPASLILLDEPEVSLHPGAQERLMEFLTMQAKKNKHQIIISTHSPAIIRHLPPDAIKVLAVSSTNGKIKLLSDESRPEEAFSTIGEPVPDKKVILVEDKLAGALVLHALRRKQPNLVKLVKMKYYPGGAGSLFKAYLPFLAAEGRTDVVCFLDGDQAKLVKAMAGKWGIAANDTEEPRWPDEALIPAKENPKLGEIIKALSGVDIEFPIDSGSQEAKDARLVEARRNFCRWAHKFVRYLPGDSNPEQLLLSHVSPAGNAAKSAFVDMTRSQLGRLPDEAITSSEIFATQERYVNSIKDDDPILLSMANSVRDFYDHI